MGGLLHLLVLGSLVFQPLREYPDLALKCQAPANAKAEMVTMPKATGYLKTNDDIQWLEDRFDVFDLWLAEALRARWKDRDGSHFSICRIPRKIPGDAAGETRTRADFATRYAAAQMGPKDLESLDEAVYLLSPVDVFLRFRPRRSQRQNLTALWQYETTNDNAFVFAFRPRAAAKAEVDWYMVSLVSDDPEAEEKLDEWLDDVEWLAVARDDGDGDDAPDRRKEKARGKAKVVDDVEREVALLAADYRRRVINYDDWHFASASNIVVVDNMPDIDRTPFLAALTNRFLKMQAAYRETLPSPLTCASHIAAVRIFGSREEYLAYVGPKMTWSAALWSPLHRELVLFLPEQGSQRLLNTVWHEALHQHLDYACSMYQPPVWFNEGHAELFEHTHFDMDDNLVFDLDPDAAPLIHENARAFAEDLPALFFMDYDEFYDGTDEERRMRYRLAWSVAYFLQVGAPNVRFQPFKDLRRDLMKAVISTGRRTEATKAVLTDEMLKDLVAEWLAFWRRQ